MTALARALLLPLRLLFWLPRLPFGRFGSGTLRVPVLPGEERTPTGTAVGPRAPGMASPGRAKRGRRRLGLRLRGGLAVPVAIVAALMLVAGAVAYFTVGGSGSGAAKAGTLGAPTGVSGTATASTVAVSWSAPVTTIVPPQGYYVTRTDGSPTPACGSNATHLITSAVTCTDGDGTLYGGAGAPSNSPVPDGTYTYTVTAVYENWTATSDASDPVTVSTVGPLDHFDVTPATGSRTAGTPFTVTVTAKDASNTTITSYSGTIQFTSNDPIAVHPSDYTFTGGDAGVHTFTTGVTLKTAGTGKTVHVTDGGATGTATYTVVHAAATQIVLTGSIADLASGSSRTFTATIADAYGNTVDTGADSSVSVSFTKTAGAGSVSGTGSSTASGGVATKDLTGVLAGSVTVRANATLSGPGSTDSNTLTFNVTHGAATKIVMSGSTAGLASGSTRLVTATIEDAAGNTVAGGPDASDSITFSQSGGTGSVTGLAGAVAASGGVATKTVTGSLAGTVSVQGAGTVNGSPTTSTNTLDFTVTFGTASQIVMSGSTAGLASGSTRLVTATIEDAAGNTVAGGPDASDSITFSQSGGTGSVTGLAGAVAASGGVATKTVTGSLAGTVSVQGAGTVNGSPTTSTNTLDFTVTFGTASQIVMSGSTAGLASGSTRLVTATIEDAAGNTVAGGPDASDSITFSQSGGTGSVTGLAGAVAASGGVATKTVTGSLAGTVSVQGAGTVNGSPTTSTNTLDFTVTFGTASQIVMSGSTAGLASGSTRLVTATIEDAAGNTVAGGPDASDSITFSQSGGTGSVTGLAGAVAASGGVATKTVTGSLAGTVSVQGAGTVNGSPTTSTNTLDFTVTFGTASQIVMSGSTAGLASGSTRLVTATIEDAAGNTVAGGPDASDSITFSQSGGTGSVTGLAGAVAASGGVATKTVTGSLAGTVSVQGAGTVNGSPTTSTNTLDFTVTFGTLDHFAFVLASPQTSGVPFTGTNTLTAQDAAGNTITDFDASANNVTVTANSGLTGTVSFTTGATGNVLNGAGDFTSGVANLSSVGLGMMFTGSGAGTFTATSGGKTGTSGPVTIASSDTFVVTNPGTQTAGAAFNVTITAKLSGGATDTGYNGAKCITFTGPLSSPNSTAPSYPAPGGSCSAGQSSVTFVNGVSNPAPSVTLYDATSSTTLTATQGSITGNTSFAVNSAGVTLTIFPTGTVDFAKNGTSPTFTIGVPADAYGNSFTRVGGLAVTITFSNTSHFTASPNPLTITSGTRDQHVHSFEQRWQDLDHELRGPRRVRFHRTRRRQPHHKLDD